MRKPNILLIICDQQNIDAISAYRKYFSDQEWGAHWLNTPNLDRMIDQGTSFLQANSNNPVCGPARSTIFTGRMATETGVTYNNVGIDKEMPNLGQWLETYSDYSRYYCGKWHGGGPWNYPHLTGNRKIPGFETLPVGYGGTGDFIDYQVSSACKSFLNNYQEEHPFFLVAGLMNPHDICFWTKPLFGEKAVSKEDYFNLKDKLPPLPKNFDETFEGWGGEVTNYFSEEEWKNYTYDYYRMVEKMDTDVGRLLAAVDSRDDDTIVIFTSDHGEGLGRHRRVQKWHPFEESMHIPMIFYAPGIIRSGNVNEKNLVSHVDIFPTICDYAEIETVPESRGSSLKKLLEDGVSAEWQDHIYSEFHLTGRVIRSERYKYIKKYVFSGNRNRPFLDKSNGQPTKGSQGIGAELFIEDDEVLFFDLYNDPWERENLSNKPEMKNLITSHEDKLKVWEAKLIPGTAFIRA